MGTVLLTQADLNSYKSQNVQKTFFASFYCCMFFVKLEIICGADVMLTQILVTLQMVQEVRKLLSTLIVIAFLSAVV